MLAHFPGHGDGNGDPETKSRAEHGVLFSSGIHSGLFCASTSRTQFSPSLAPRSSFRARTEWRNGMNSVLLFHQSTLAVFFSWLSTVFSGLISAQRTMPTRAITT